MSSAKLKRVFTGIVANGEFFDDIGRERIVITVLGIEKRFLHDHVVLPGHEEIAAVGPDFRHDVRFRKQNAAR